MGVKAILLVTAGGLAGFAAGWVFRPVVDLEGASPSRGGPAAVLGTLPAAARREPAETGGLDKAGGETRRAPFAPGEARGWLQGLSGLDYLKSRAGEDALNEMLQSFAPEDFRELERAVLDELKDPSRPGSRRKFSVRFLWMSWPWWIKTDPEGALASMNLAARMDPEMLEDDTVQKVFRRFASKDPQAAMRALEQIPEDRRRDAALGIVMEAAADGPFAALETAKQLGLSVEPDMFVDAAVERDPVRAAELTAGFSGDAPQNNTFLRAIEQWSEVDPAAAEAWMRAYQGPGYTTGMTAVLARQARTDPAGAAAEFLKLENAAENFYAPRLAGTISQSLYKQSGSQGAIAWAEMLAPRLQAAAVAETIRHWAGDDPESASGWLATRSSGPVRDAGALSLISAVSETSPAEAWQWAQSLSASETRSHTLNVVQHHWQKIDPAAAQAALEALNPPSP